MNSHQKLMDSIVCPVVRLVNTISTLLCVLMTASSFLQNLWLNINRLQLCHGFYENFRAWSSITYYRLGYFTWNGMEYKIRPSARTPRSFSAPLHRGHSARRFTEVFILLISRWAGSHHSSTPMTGLCPFWSYYVTWTGEIFRLIFLIFFYKIDRLFCCENKGCAVQGTEPWITENLALVGD